MPIVSEQRVRYAETDQMNVVYYANYLVWFEIGRVELLRALGFDYKQMEDEYDCILPVVEASCRYRSPARYDDLVQIEADPTLLKNSVLKFAYRLSRKEADGSATLLAEGETVHVVCTHSMQRCPMPRQYEQAIRDAMQAAKLDRTEKQDETQEPTLQS
ncbi:acyl-CoA thioesterase [Acidicapsa dinghuensis]|uniref:Acyl-CoA thioesterase n=1 Tax=Acidicapsa dinghuensis TaxID=2218256 RepID=A0ABW1EFH9_9BACT|nr:thioesterase family protein [Acidicapsa dinghuensis]